MRKMFRVSLLLVLTLYALTGVQARAAAFKVGIECPTQLPMTPALEAALRKMGISYLNYYIYNKMDDLPAEEINDAMMALCDRLGIDYSIGCHHVDPLDECVKAAANHGKTSGRFKGVVFDEIEHCRLLWAYSSTPLADASKFKTLPHAYETTLAAYDKIHARFTSLGAPATVATHVWPVMEHIAARAGFAVCPKICKETYSPVSFAIAMGAAKQYGRDLWADCDLWFWDMIPGHPPEEMKCNLLMAYWLGADVVYIEGAGNNLRAAGKQATPFALVNIIDSDTYQLTPHGEVLRWFCKEYLPANPRPWSFRDVKPSIAIVRFEDTCHGQRYTSDYEDNLYGSPNLHSNRDTEAWFGLWNLITFGKTGRDGLSFFKAWVAPSGYQEPVQKGVAQSYTSRPVCADIHKFFVPLSGAVVYDHLAGYDLLKDIPLLFLTGTEVSEETMAAIHRCVKEGAVCVAWGPLAAKHGFEDWKSGVKVIPAGKGRFVLTDDFGLREAYREIRTLIGHPDEINYRFGDHRVVLRKISDNEISVEVRRQEQ